MSNVDELTETDTHILDERMYLEVEMPNSPIKCVNLIYRRKG
jgi:hypothetical protein